MHKTLNDVPANAKKVAIELLNARLADILDLKAATKQAHWNVKGPHFIALHELFDKLAAELDEHADTMAERVTALGGTALGTTQVVGQATKLEPYPTDIYEGTAHLKALIKRYGAFANSVRKSIDESDEAGEADTADVFTGVSRGADKALWFLEAHTQEKA